MRWRLRTRQLGASLLCLVALLALLGSFPGLAASPAPEVPAAPPQSLTYQAEVLRPTGYPELVPVQLYVPADAAARQPLSVLVALHGMGGNGQSVARPLEEFAERRGWVVVAPTIRYGDWRDPQQVRADASDVLPALQAILAGLPAQTGLRLRPRALLYGFSRGAQVAHRFALLYPEQALAVAALSAGTYTLPQIAPQVRPRAEPRDDDFALDLSFPFGVADVERYTGRPFRAAQVCGVRFWVGVGALDQRPQDVPRVWDPLIGASRVERAASFAAALRALGAEVELVQFPGVGHQETAEMRQAALAFLGAAVGRDGAPAGAP